MTTTLDDLAALDALGILNDDEQAELRRLVSSAGRAALDDASLYREVVTHLAESLDAVTPPAAIKQKVMRAVSAKPGDTLRANEGNWTTIAPGVRLKKLSSDRARHTVMVLMEMQPGAAVPPHEHTHAEDSYIISGSARLGELVLFAGDYHHVEAGSRHDSIVSDDGCLALLVMDAEDYLAA
jgi:anti-sigma factor ChrR (cupin superfamily)